MADQEVTESNETIKVVKSTNRAKNNLLYGVCDIPPIGVTILLALQNFIAVFGTFATYVYVISPKLCLDDNDPRRGYLLSTCFFASGFGSFMMSTFGIRLPVVQGTSYFFLLPTLLALDNLGEECPVKADNQTVLDFIHSEAYDSAWKFRIRTLQGAILMGGILEMIVGLSGVIGYLIKFITPLTIAPIIIQLGIAIMPVAGEKINQNIYVSILTIIFVTIFSQYMADIPLKVPRIGQPNHPKKFAKFFAFKMFGILISIMLMWLVCFLGSISNHIPSNNKARTDSIDYKLVTNSPWIRIPYPFQWGLPIFTLSTFMTILPAQLTSIFDSLGDYFAAASITQSPNPPKQVMGRGIFVEGIGQVLSGVTGSGAGLSSYSSNIGAIAITRAGSRRVIQYYGLILMIASLCGKVSAFAVIIPSPILSGVFVVMIGIMTAVGFTLLKNVDMKSPRNLFILGVSLMLGGSFPSTIKNPNAADITGYALIDTVIKNLFSNGSLLSGIIAFILDNTIPGSKAERGLESKSIEKLDQEVDQISSEAINIYRLPYSMDKWIRNLLGPWPVLLPTKLLQQHQDEEINMS